jgi:hypothetical protein
MAAAGEAEVPESLTPPTSTVHRLLARAGAMDTRAAHCVIVPVREVHNAIEIYNAALPDATSFGGAADDGIPVWAMPARRDGPSPLATSLRDRRRTPTRRVPPSS